MEKMGNGYGDWHDLLFAISGDADFPMNGKQRGTVFSLLASPPVTLSEEQVTILTELKTKWEARRTVHMRENQAADPHEQAVEDREAADAKSSQL